jgi:carboxylesterase type B
MRRTSVVSAIFTATIATVLVGVVTAAGPTVTVAGLECGSVEGTLSPIANEWGNETRTVAAFLGIPFATPPVGNLRFAPPVANTCWEKGTSYNATYFRSFCMQPDTSGNEDCLYLNIYVPESILKRNDSSKLAPVSFYIHGGGLTGGSGVFEPFSFFSAYAGDEGCVAVTINYRLGVLGFLAHTELRDPATGVIGNYGILDQLLALQWVQSNIKAFGGDPTRVTLGGQSSGGTSIFALMASPMSKGLFHAAVSFSGSPNITLDAPGKLAQDIAIPASVNCSGANVAECLRNVSAASLILAMPNSWNTPGLFHMRNLTPAGRDFAGLVYVDGVVLTMPFEDAMAAGLNGDVAMIIANMGQECNLINEGGNVSSMNITEWQAHLLHSTFSAWGPRAPQLAEDVFALYSTEAAINPLLAYDSINTDYGLTCANSQIAVRAKRERRYRAPIYISVNQWPPGYPDNNHVTSYAYHTWDYEMAINNDLLGVPISDMDRQMGKLVRDSWYSLMALGKVSADVAHLDWKPVDADAGFPELFSTFVYSRPDRFPFETSRTHVNYKHANCAILGSYGFDRRYWWCD